MEIKEYVLKRKEVLKTLFAGAAKKAHLEIIVAGANPASDSYIRGKMKDAEEVGIYSHVEHLSENVSESELLNLIVKDNLNPLIDGLLVQLPLPHGISETKVHETIDPQKDVDGFSPSSPYDSCTPKGIIDYLTEEGFLFRGKNAVVIGRSRIVGRPMASLLLAHDCNVTVLHSKTSDEDMRFYLKHADLLVVAVGRLAMIDKSYELKKTAWVVDVGINRGDDGKLHGDCAPGLPVALQTPVPGGVGLLTRLALLENLWEVISK